MEEFIDPWVKKKQRQKTVFLICLAIVSLIGIALIVLSKLFTITIWLFNNDYCFYLGVCMAVFGVLDFILFSIPTKKERTEKKQDEIIKKAKQKIEKNEKKNEKVKRVCLYCGAKVADDAKQCPLCGHSL